MRSFFLFAAFALLALLLSATPIAGLDEEELVAPEVEVKTVSPLSVDTGCINETHSCHEKARCVIGLTGYECQCLKGYAGDGYFICADIDECDPSHRKCHPLAVCTNFEGGFECACPEGYQGDGVAECVLGDRGTFRPRPIDVSPPEPIKAPGLYLELRGGESISIDQKQATSYKDPGWSVFKAGGALAEAEVWYELPQDLNTGRVGTYEIEYQATDKEGNVAEKRYRKVEVTDIDECALGEHACSENAECINTIGGYECVCKEGFAGDGFKCHDVDECKLGTHNCHEKANCTNTVGSYICTCQDGYEGDGFTCVDIDECARNTAQCDEHATCINLEGSYDCECEKGYKGDGWHCEAIDSCEEGTHDCDEHAVCTKTNDTPEGYRCKCKRGFVGDGRICEDINECLDPDLYNCPAHSHCVNTVGSYRCECDEGFEKADDDYTCRDIDECLLEIHECSPHAICTNTMGSYECTCKPGYEGNGRVCAPLQPPLDIQLEGDNPLVLNKCETYNEEGFTLTNKEKNLRVTTTIPSALTAPFIQDLGNFTVTYTVYDGRERLGAMERLVVVNAINPCELPVGHRCRHKCHPYAQCVFLGGSDYDCECREGFDKVIDPITGEVYCKDNQPPVIFLQGQNPTILRACRVCQWYDPGESYSEEKHGGFFAYDNLPDGRQVDLTSRVRITNESLGANEWALYYNVEDAAGNQAETKTRIVRKEVEDVFEKIARMEQFLESRFEDFQPAFTTYNALYSYGRWFLQVIFFLFGFIVLWVLVPRLLGLGRVLLFNPNPTFPEFQYAYDFYYTLTRPWWNQQEREKQTMVMWQKRKYDKHQ